jgi:hypothetical protein
MPPKKLQRGSNFSNGKETARPDFDEAEFDLPHKKGKAFYILNAAGSGSSGNHKALAVSEYSEEDSHCIKGIFPSVSHYKQRPKENTMHNPTAVLKEKTMLFRYL